MNAVEFVREFAVFGAKEYLAGATFYKDKLMVFTDIDDLKQIVEAYELVGDDLEYTKKFYADCAFKTDKHLRELKKAINLVEQCQ